LGNSGSTHYHAIQNVVFFPIVVQKSGKRAGNAITVKEEQKSDQETKGTHHLINLGVNDRTILKLSSRQRVGIYVETPPDY
jgi:hypothetical protein